MKSAVNFVQMSVRSSGRLQAGGVIVLNSGDDLEMLKQKKQRRKQSAFFLCAAILLYAAAGVMLLPYYRYQINPDGISYISIAGKYLRGNYFEAVNGYWSPLFSWLLIPWLSWKTDPLLAAKIVNLLIGACAIAALYSLACRYQMSRTTRSGIVLASLPVILYFAYGQITPDLLTAVLLLLYLNLIFDVRYPVARQYGALCGIIGGAAYLSKSYCFPFFVIHFPLMNALHYLRNRSASNRKSLVRHLCLGLALFFLVSSPWIYLLSHKYNTLLFSTAGSINLANVHPNPSRHQQPSFRDTPDRYAYSLWDDPFFDRHIVYWNPFASPDYMKHWTGIFIMHVLQVLKIFAGFSCAVFLGVVVYCTGLLFTKPGKLLSDPEIVFSLATIVLYSAGYCLVHVEERFFMIVCFLFMPLGGYLLDNIFRKNFLKTGRNALLILLVLSFAVVPVPQLTKNVNADKEIYLLGDAMRKYVPPHSRIAASGYWYESLYVAFHLQSAIYGTTEQLQAGAAKQELDRYAVNYFIDWGSHGDTSLFLTAFIETGKAEYNDRAVTVYKRKDG